jgi:hypothetical protein
MKLQVKLSKDEATAFENDADVCKPQEVSMDDFVKTIFLTGVESLNAKKLRGTCLASMLLKTRKSLPPQVLLLS